MKIRKDELKNFLEEKYQLYNNGQFIKSDPVSIPHRFTKKQDIEISGFLAAIIAWGQRPVILKNAMSLLVLMDNDPHNFILHCSKSELRRFNSFVHRTFNESDCKYFIGALSHIYNEYDSMEALFKKHVHSEDKDFKNAISGWRADFFSYRHLKRTEKHFANPQSGSAAKKINMFLRWMIRKDNNGVDFGVWNLSPALLTCPLDVHSARVARKLGLLKRKITDWQAAEELTNNLKKFDRSDPVKYDFALFGLGVFENF